MFKKYPVCPDRVRQVPRQFSWVDQRLVRDGHIESLSHQAAAMYLFLITVSDAQGLSYYSDQSLQSRLAMDVPVAREELIGAGLVAYKKPIYQVLPLENQEQGPRSASNQPQSFSTLLKHIMEKDHD